MKSSLRSSLAILLGFGLPAALGAQTSDAVAPAPKTPGQTGIITPDGDAPPELVDTRETPADGAVTSAEETRLNTVLLTALKGIGFVTSLEDAKAMGDVGGVVAPDDLPLLSTSDFQTEVASKYLGQPVSLASIHALNRDVVSFFKKKGRPVVDVIVPEQDITSGTLRLIVLQGRLGSVTVEGNKYFSSEMLAAKVSVAPGETLDSDRILADLNWLNQNPFRRVGLVYSRGAEVGTTDITLQVEDRRPLRLYVGYENSGNNATGNDRFLAGLNWGNAFGLDHQFNYQFAVSDTYEDFYAHSASYVIPLPSRHTLTFYGAYANSSAEVVAGLLTADGESYSAGFRYAIPLKSTRTLNQELFWGYDYKFSSNILTFGVPLPASKTETNQFNLGYGGSLRDSLGATSLTVTGFFSPGGITSYDSDADYDQASAGSSADYYYGRVTLERITRLPADFSLLTSITGQLASDNLLVSEQLGAGGYATVRGYDERVANAENGIIGRVELRSFPISVRETFNLQMPSDQLQFLGFWDAAMLYRYDRPAPGLADSYNLGSAGIGFRYSIAQYLSVRFDYGWQLRDDANVGGQGNSRGHVGVILSY